MKRCLLTTCKHKFGILCIYLYNNKCYVRCVLDVRGLMRACDASLEPHWRKNDQGMNFFWFARAARPQRAKMCFFTT